MSGKITVKNWETFQHYKDRRPPWIKLYRDLLDDRQYRALDDFSARLLFDVWLLAADASDPLAGCITYDTAEIAWRLRLPDESKVESGLRKLVSAGFVTISGANASDTLARCLQLAIPETETETETETEGEKRQNARVIFSNNLSPEALDELQKLSGRMTPEAVVGELNMIVEGARGFHATWDDVSLGICDMAAMSIEVTPNSLRGYIKKASQKRSQAERGEGTGDAQDAELRRIAGI